MTEPLTPLDWTASLEAPEKWASLALIRCSDYEASTHGNIRSIDRVKKGRTYKSVTLRQRPNNDGYHGVTLIDDDGNRKSCTVHSLVLLAFGDGTHPPGRRPPGMQASHQDDVQSHNWLSNLRWETDPQNRRRRQENHPPAPKPPRPARYCVVCDAPVTTNGRRCHDCVVAIGVKAAAMLRAGDPPGRVAAALDYPSADGVVTLAIRHGGYGRSQLARQAQRVITTLRHLLLGGPRSATRVTVIASDRLWVRSQAAAEGRQVGAASGWMRDRSGDSV